MTGTRLILCAYHEIGCKVIEHVLQRSDIADLAVFTHKPVMDAPDLEAFTKKHGVWCSTENVSQCKLPFEPDVISSVYYRYIIEPTVIGNVEGRIFNVHPSLLPRHRGCSAVPWAMIDGDSVTGVTFHYIDPGVDTGRVILQATLPIYATDTQVTLYQRLMNKGAQFWPAAFELVRESFPGVEQEGEPSYHKRGAPCNGEIDDRWPIDKIERFVRAMTFPPYPHASYKGSIIRSLDDYLDLTPPHTPRNRE